MTVLDRLLAAGIARHPHEDGPEWRTRAPWLRNEVDQLLDEDIPIKPESGSVGRGRISHGGTVPNAKRGYRERP